MSEAERVERVAAARSPRSQGPAGAEQPGGSGESGGSGEPAEKFRPPTYAGNRRGRRSRQEILDAAARVMSVRGYAGTSMSALSKETGLPKSAFYHHFESKAGLLSAVMEQGAHDFFAAMRRAHRNPPEDGDPRERLRWYLRRTGEALEHGEEFLRLLMVLVMSREAAEAPEAMRTVIAVRDEGRALMRHMVRSSFAEAGDEAADQVADALAAFGMAGFDGAFVALQSEGGKPISEWMEQLADAMAALGGAMLSRD